MRTQAELVIKGDTKSAEEAGRKTTRAIDGMVRSTKSLTDAAKEAAKAIDGMSDAQKAFVAGLDGLGRAVGMYKQLAAAANKAAKAMGAAAAAGGAGGGGGGPPAPPGGARPPPAPGGEPTGGSQNDRATKDAAAQTRAMRAMAFAQAATQLAAGQNALAPYSTMGSTLGAAVGPVSSMVPVVGPAAGAALAAGAAGMQIRQQRMDRYLSYRGAYAGAAPHIAGAGVGFGAGFGMTPEEAMGTARGFSGATGGEARFGRTALEMSTRGFSPAAAIGGSLTEAGAGIAESVREAFGGPGGIMSNQGKVGFAGAFLDQATAMARAEAAAFGGDVTPGRIEKHLQRIAQFTSSMAERGVEVDPFALGAIATTVQQAGLGLAGQAGLTRQSLAGGRAVGLMQQMQSASQQEGGLGGFLGLMASGLGEGVSLPEVLRRREQGLFATDGGSAQGFVGGLQRMFGRGGAETDMMDVIVGKALGMSIKDASAMRRIDEGAFAPTRLDAGAGFRGMQQYTGMPEQMAGIHRKMITDGAQYAKISGELLSNMYSVQTGLADLAGAFVPVVADLVKLAAEGKAALGRLGIGSSVPASPGRGR